MCNQLRIQILEDFNKYEHLFETLPIELTKVAYLMFSTKLAS